MLRPEKTTRKSNQSSVPRGILYLLSLRLPYVWTTSLIVILLFLLYLLLDLFLKTPDWAPLIPALFFYSYVWGIWILFLFSLFGKQRKENESILLADLFILYAFTLLQYTTIYATVARIDENSFIGIPGDAKPITRIGLSLFLAMETMAALGTGAIFANKESVWGFIPIAIQSIQSILFIGLIVAKVLIVTQRGYITANKRLYKNER